MERVEAGGLRIDKELHDFVNGEALPGPGISADAFWSGLGGIVRDLGPKVAALLKKRDALQEKIDAWHKARGVAGFEQAEYERFLRDIGYLQAAPTPGQISTMNVDDEIAHLAGPQLVVPMSNARYALNAANARWGSLYDALYGTDAVVAEAPGRGYDKARGDKVIAVAKAALDKIAPLASGTHADASGYTIKDGALTPALADPSRLAGWTGSPDAPSVVLLKHNGIHAVIHID